MKSGSLRQAKLKCGFLKELAWMLLPKNGAQGPTTSSPSDWNGDSTLCTANSGPMIDDKPVPKFSSQAEFTMTKVGISQLLNITLPSELNIYQYFYDYDANKMIRIQYRNGSIDIKYYYYDILKMSTYYEGKFCVVSDIPTNSDLDGASAIELSSGQWHIRPLNEFLLFSNTDSQRPIIRPIYNGSDIVRGIPVDKWESCLVDKTQYRTVRYTWFLAQNQVELPTGIVGQNAVPIQGIFSASISYPNGTRIAREDEIFNIYSYRPSISENNDKLAVPKGVFCSSGPDQALISLQSIGIQWPDRFSVGVEVLTSRSSQWQRFHLRHTRSGTDGSSFIQYDYIPIGSEDSQSVLHDYGNNLTYTINRHSGSCQINSGTEFLDVNPIRNPVGFFLKNQQRFMFETSARIWEFSGFQSCRGDSIKCVRLVTSFDNFPAIIDPDTGKPTGETWAATNMEYGWSMRTNYSRPILDGPKQFDYPVYLFLKMYRFIDPDAPTAMNILTETIEYQFYEMTHDLESSDFDISICYRSLDLPYVQLGFVLKPGNNILVDSKYLNRRTLQKTLSYALVNVLQVNSKRVSLLEFYHIRFDNSIHVLFTLLGPIVLSNSKEPSIETAQQRLETTINAGQFIINTTLLDNDNSVIEFMAQPDSLKTSKQFMSIHASSLHTNISYCNVSDTNSMKSDIANCAIHNVTDEQTTVISRIKREKYTVAAQAGSIIGGLFLGIVLGFIVLILVKFLNKNSTSAVTSASISGGLRNISCRQTNSIPSLEMQTLRKPVDDTHS